MRAPRTGVACKARNAVTEGFFSKPSKPSATVFHRFAPGRRKPSHKGHGLGSRSADLRHDLQCGARAVTCVRAVGAQLDPEQRWEGQEDGVMPLGGYERDQR